MSSIESRGVDPQRLAAMLAAILTLSACAAAAPRTENPSRDCYDSMEQPYGLCDKPVG